MIAWINLVCLIIATILSLYFYVKTAETGIVGTKNAAIESLKLTQYQTFAELLMALVGINYVVYFLYPIPLSIPQTFPWSWWVSATIAMAIGLLSSYYWWRSLSEQPDPAEIWVDHQQIKESQLFSYFTFWLCLGFLLHSPFLLLFSLTWIPIYLLLNWWENQAEKNHIDGSKLMGC